jgi:hypothetical protein
MGSTEDEFYSNLEFITKVLSEKGITLNPDKCEIGVEIIDFVGHTIDTHGYCQSIEKREKLLSLAKPTTVNELQQFTGLVNYLRGNIPELSTLMAALFPMQQGRAKDKLIWTPKTDEGFEEVRKRVTSMSTLSFPKEDAPIILATDTCTTGLGVHLFQVVGYNEDGSEQRKHIAFLSKKFNDVESRW